MVLAVKNLPANAGDARGAGASLGQKDLGRKDPLEEGTAAHSGVLAWRIPWTEEPDGLQSIGLNRVGHNCSDLARTHKLRPREGRGLAKAE